MARFSILALVLLSGPLVAQTVRFRDQVMATPTVYLDVAYGAALNRHTNQVETLRLDFYDPPLDPLSLRPALVVVHGGSFAFGDKGETQMKSLCTDLARLGYVAVSINYRLQPTGIPITQQTLTDVKEDAKASIRWLRANAALLHVDAERIASLGTSAGAYAVLEAAYVDGEGNSGNPGWPSHVRAVVDFWGGLSNVNTMDTGEPPVCIVHGTNDGIVSYANATALASRAQTVGVPFELHALNAGHEPWQLAPQFMPNVVAFLYEHLQLAQLSGLQGEIVAGSVLLHTCGVAADLVVLCLAGAQQNVSLGALGEFCLHPATLVVLPPIALPATPRLPTLTFPFVVPPGVRGTVWWQVLQARGPALHTLTNCVPTVL